tara:strand:+ start:310 stop:456 length:147 start_codon:yes stop_codon:yes gene_type:complete
MKNIKDEAVKLEIKSKRLQIAELKKMSSIMDTKKTIQKLQIEIDNLML